MGLMTWLPPMRYFGINTGDCDAAGARSQVPAQRGAEATRRATPVSFRAIAEEASRMGAERSQHEYVVRMAAAHRSWSSWSRGRVVGGGDIDGKRRIEYAQDRLARKAG